MESIGRQQRSSLRPISDAFPTFSAAAVASPASGTGTGSGGWFSSFSWTTLIIIILALALVGINVFMYLAQGTTLLAQGVKWIGGGAAAITGDVLQTAGTGVKAGVGGAVGAVKGAAEGTVQGATAGAATQILPGTGPTASQASSPTTRSAAPATATDTEEGQSPSQNLAIWREDTLQKALDDASARMQIGGAAPRDSDLTTTSGKSGWCLVGEARGAGTRTCAPVGVNDVCMSGDIFPTQDVCVNPSLRA